MPNCNSHSAASSRRSSRVSCNSYSVFSGKDSAASSRRSSGPPGSRPGSRRGSLLVTSYTPINHHSTCTSWPEASSVNTMHDSLASLRLKCDNSKENEMGSLSSPSTPPITSQQQSSSSGTNNIWHNIGSGVVGSSSSFYFHSATFSRTRYRNVTGPFQRPKFRDRHFQ